jgi:RNA polymerase sigma-70 factor (ECF subfamily)
MGKVRDKCQDKHIFYTDLYEANVKDLSRYAYRITGNYELAPDLVHEAFLILFLRIEYVMAHPNPAGWLHKTLEHVCQKKLRQWAGKKEMPLKEAIIASLMDKASASGDTLLEILPITLSEEDRQILVLRFQEQLSYAEIANRLGIEEPTCRKRVSRAVQHCADLKII